MIFFLLFLVAGLVALGWLVWQQQQSMAQMSDQLTQAHNQVTLLSAQLTDTETNITASAEDAGEQIRINESEIRKLWDLSNKRNKAWIQTNQANIAGLEESNNTLKQLIAQNETDFNTSMSQVLRQQRDVTDKVNVLMQQFRQLNESLVNQVNQNTESIQAIDTSRQQNNQRILDVSRRVFTLENRVGTMETRSGS